MNIYRNENLIKRNARIAQISMLSGLAVLGAGMFLSFRNPEQFSLSLGALLLGFILSQIGIFYSNRWGRRPRQDELIDLALKGLDKKFSLYHYLTPVNHLLIGPSGTWALLPYYQRGRIVYQNGRWQQKGGNLYLKIFAQEGLGRPELDVVAAKESLDKFIASHFPDEDFPPAEVALIFTNERTVVDIPEDADPPAATVSLKDLKELIRKSGKNRSLPMEKVKLLEDALRDS